MKLLYPDWPAPPHVKAFTTLRHDNFDLTTDTNACNRSVLFNENYVPSQPFWLSQIHSATIVEYDNNINTPKADASYTFQSKQVCVVLTADCLPILLTDTSGSFVAAIHAGWRGLAQNIITKTLQTITSNNHEILAWLGPGIGPNAYQIGHEVRDCFLKLNPNNEEAFKPKSHQQWLCDLYTIARLELHKNNVTQIYGGKYCTFTQQTDFFSYRREGKNAGRMGSFIWRD